MKKQVISSLLSLTLLCFSSSYSFAAIHGVLGESTSDLSVPPTVEGPGFILPDNPFYFLDGVKQNVRLFLAFSPEKKAQVHADVAGERLAELRVMLARNDQDGAVIALEGVGTNLQAAANDLEDAKLQGKNTSKIAEKINLSIKEKQYTLDVLEAQGGDLLKARVKVVQESLRDAKLGVNASLPGDMMEQELEDDINRAIETHVTDATRSARGLERSIDVLTKLASQAATKNQTAREEALRKAIEKKNEMLTREKKEELDEEIATQEAKLKISAEESAAARETVKKALEAAEKFKKAQQAKEEFEQSRRTKQIEKSENPGRQEAELREAKNGESNSEKNR